MATLNCSKHTTINFCTKDIKRLWKKLFVQRSNNPFYAKTNWNLAKFYFFWRLNSNWINSVVIDFKKRTLLFNLKLKIKLGFWQTLKASKYLNRTRRLMKIVGIEVWKSLSTSVEIWPTSANTCKTKTFFIELKTKSALYRQLGLYRTIWRILKSLSAHFNLFLSNATNIF